MTAHPRSLLVRITDLLAARGPALGRILHTAPSHHVVMENILHGKPPSTDSAAGATTESDGKDGAQWETYDLKPHTYFYPERDLAGGRLAPADVKERLADVLPDKLRLSPGMRADLLALIDADTALLERHNAVDYSLFLVRYPALPVTEALDGEVEKVSWRTGVRSSDGAWVYRAVVLDFFWAKHKTRPRLMTALVAAFDFFARTGHMSITTTPEEYRRRFLDMVQGYIEVEDDVDGVS